VAFVFVDLFTPGSIDGLYVSQVIFFPDQVVPVIGFDLDEDAPLEIDIVLDRSIPESEPLLLMLL
jgi:hypothetical protein